MKRVKQFFFGRLDDRAVTRDIYVKLVALLGFGAFLSLQVQVGGLIGKNGILPVIRGIETIVGEQGWWSFLRHPSVLVFWPTNYALNLLGYLGMVASVLLFVGFVPRVTLFIMWLLYLSLALAGQKFTSYQWDILIIETFFYSIAVAPKTILPGKRSCPPPRIGVFLLNLLLFKLMFLGGLAKLTGGDPTWWNLTALEYHFETQPLPNPVSWFVHQLPTFLLKIGTVLTLVVEVVVPFFLFFPRFFRLTAVYFIALLQVLILVTGNYGPFNLHALILCVMQLDDRHIRFLFPEPSPSYLHDAYRGGKTLSRFASAIALILILLNGMYFYRAWGTKDHTPEWIRESVQFVGRFNTINSYGLFANMTTVRREIIIQGSEDGTDWKNYEFPYKPGDPHRRPPIVFPHMPRLDWQMWFAALKPPERVKWMPALLFRILRGSKPVLSLLDDNPFQGDPPQYVRAIMYRYQFTSWEEGFRTGRWWRRGKRQTYFPPVEIRNGRLRRVRLPP